MPVSATRGSMKKSVLGRLRHENPGVSLEEGLTIFSRDLDFTIGVETTHPPMFSERLVSRLEGPRSSVKNVFVKQDCSSPEERQENRLKPGFIGTEFTLHQHWTYGDGKIEEVLKTFKNERGFFTVGELEKCVVEFEREARQLKTWHDGEGSRSVDAHHVYFEGFREYVDKNGEPLENHYAPLWGS